MPTPPGAPTSPPDGAASCSPPAGRRPRPQRAGPRDRLAGQRPTREVRLADGTHASAGDLVVTRHNDRSLRTRSGGWVKNGDRWVVRGVETDGDLSSRGRHSTDRRQRDRHPPRRLRRSVRPARLRRAPSTAPKAPPSTPPTRSSPERRAGRASTSPSPEDASRTTSTSETARHPPRASPSPPNLATTAHARPLTRILERDERAESATRAGASDPHHEFVTLVQQYEDALPLLAQHVLGDERMRLRALERWMPGLTTQPGYQGLRGQIAIRWADGDSPNEVLQRATWWQSKEELVREDDSAAALARNVARTSLGTSDEGSARWLPAVPRLIRSHESAGAYLERLDRRINELASLSEPPGRAPEHDDRLSTGRSHQQRAVPARAPVGRGAGGPRR